MALTIFLKFGMLLTIDMRKRVIGPDFSKKNFIWKFFGKTPTFDAFCQYLKKDSNYFDEILRFNNPHWYLTPRKNHMHYKNMVRAVQ